MGTIISTKWVLKVLTSSWANQTVLEKDGGDGYKQCKCS